MTQLHRFEGFYWVARTGGYARAARAFPYPITQPAVHQQVKKLERELDTELFERVGKERMLLTPAGRRIFDFVAPFFADLPAVLRSVQSGDYGGRLTVAAAPLALRHILPPWIKRLQRRKPDVEIELREELVPDPALLRGGEVDLMVDHLPEVPDDIATMRVAEMRGFLVLPAAHRLARRKRIALAELSGDTFIGYPPGSFPHELQTQALARHGAAPRNSLSASTADTILGFVESGLGFSLVPSFDPAGPKSRGITARPLTSPRISFPVYAAWRRDAPESPVLDAFLEAAPKP